MTFRLEGILRPAVARLRGILEADDDDDEACREAIRALESLLYALEEHRRERAENR